MAFCISHLPAGRSTARSLLSQIKLGGKSIEPASLGSSAEGKDMASRPRGLEQHAVSIKVGGQTVSGTYVVWDGRITVTSQFGLKQGERGRLPADLPARPLLRELVVDSRNAPP
jgi:hypothetical protein